MTDFLTNIAARSFSPASAIRPRLASLFEPISQVDVLTETDTESNDALRRAQTAEEPVQQPALTPQSRSDRAQIIHGPARHTNPDSATLRKESGPNQRPEGRKSNVTDQPETIPDRRRALTFDERDPREIAGHGPTSPDAHLRAATGANARPSNTTTSNVERVAVRSANPLLPTPSAAKLANELRGTVQSSNSQASKSRRPRMEAAAVRPSSEPDVHVTIGRIEVRAIPEKTPTRASRPSSVMSLEEYMRRRAQRGSQ